MLRMRVEGLKELERNLHALPRSVTKRVVRHALRKGGEPIIEAARARAPVRTGALRDSIGGSYRLSKRQKRLHRKASAEEYFVGAGGKGARHAHLQEFGTVHHGPQPFLRPAFMAEQGEALRIVADELGKAVMRAAKRLGVPVRR